MKIFERFIKKSTATASVAVKEEVRKTATNVLPRIIGVASVVLGIVIFRDKNRVAADAIKTMTNTTITTNNYFFRDVSEDLIRTIIEEGKK